MFVTLYITTKNVREARKISRFLIKERLVACCNIIPKIESIYWWKNRIENENESVIIAKTKKSLMNKIIKTVKKNHSYSVPCITFEKMNGNKDYLNWVKKETR